jgi:hypothetical protein
MILVGSLIYSMFPVLLRHYNSLRATMLHCVDSIFHLLRSRPAIASELAAQVTSQCSIGRSRVQDVMVASEHSYVLVPVSPPLHRLGREKLAPELEGGDSYQSSNLQQQCSSNFQGEAASLFASNFPQPTLPHTTRPRNLASSSQFWSHSPYRNGSS